MDLTNYLSAFPELLRHVAHEKPWVITERLKIVLEEIIPRLGVDYQIEAGIAIHKSVIVESGITIKRPVIIMQQCFLGANSYYREGVFLDAFSRIGPGSEIKSSVICSHSAIAHLNYIGNSLIGRDVNFEAGSVAANHYNERAKKEISVIVNRQVIPTGVTKFGAVVGDHSRIGANAVLSPGTILEKGAVVARLQLVNQLPGP